MTDHWKDVETIWRAVESRQRVYDAASVDAARAKDREDRQRERHAHAEKLAVKAAEIADLTRRLGWFMSYPCHWTRGESEYSTDCGHTAFPVTATPSGTCNGCGRSIVVSVPA